MKRVVAVVAGLVMLCAMAGCGGGNPRANLSSASTPSSASATTSVASRPSATPTVKPARLYPADVPLTGHNVKPGEKPPVYPTAAKAKTQAGANAFAEFFARTLDWMYATSNPAYVKHYEGRTCGLCAGLTTGMAKTASQHRWYLGGRFTIHPASATAIAPVTAPADYCSAMTVDTTAASIVDHTGKVYNGDGAHSGISLKLCAKFVGSQWQTTYLAKS